MKLHSANKSGRLKHLYESRFANKVPEYNQEQHSWLTTYLDTFTLLLAFFIVMTSLIGHNARIFEQLKTGLRTVRMDTEPVRYPINDLEIDLNALLAPERLRGSVNFFSNNYELRLQFSGSSFFNTGEALVLPEGQSIIERIIAVTKKLDHYKFFIDVEGHADNRPISSPVYPSNWELSAARAANIVRYFIENGYEPTRMKASGYADIFPVAPNEDEAGNPIPANMEKNRRVVIRLYY